MHGTFNFGQSADLHRIRTRLSARFGRFRADERCDPVGQFILAFIGSRTLEATAVQARAKLLQRYSGWDGIADADVAEIQVLLKDVTFPEKKAAELKEALQVIRMRVGQVNLDFLADYDVPQALEFLENIHGVGRKIAAATLNFSVLCKRSFVIDTHVLRVLRRFGLVEKNAETEAAYDAVMLATEDCDADALFELHCLIKTLGQTTCTQAQAMCASCPLSDICLRRVEGITALKALIEKPALEAAQKRVALGHDAVDACLRGGLACGALHEVFAVVGHEGAATGFALGLASCVAAGKRMLWICQNFSTTEFGCLSATGLLEFGVNPEHVLLFRAEHVDDALRAAHDALSCLALGAVVIEIPGHPKILDLVTSRRLTLAAAQKSVTVFLLRFNAEPEISAAETRWQVRGVVSPLRQEDWGYPSFDVTLLRNRRGKGGHWLMEWNCNACCFQALSQDHRSLVSASAH
jgi:protein ImuA